ncbi:MAG: cytochrome b/b6 domain-containing protein [Mariprofundaceae bacterium]
MKYDRVARILHWLIAILIMVQLLSEEFMKRPKLVDGVPRVRSDMEYWFFEGHEWFGLILLVVVLLRFVFIMDRNEWDRFFPWVTDAGRKGIVRECREIPSWFCGKLRNFGEDNYLAKSVHGLGLLLALALGMLGGILFVGMNPDGSMDDFVHLCKEAHELLGEFLWVYMYGHLFMTAYHQILGHRALQRMFGKGV